MILGPISLIDCLVFCLFLAPELLIQVGIVRTALVAFQALPFICVWLPFQFIRERYWDRRATRTPFVNSSTAFEDFVIRCVRWGFRNIQTNVARAFFSKRVAIPFVRWRMLRHGYLRFPVHWQECFLQDKQGAETKGIWIVHKPEQRPDFVVYYIHGGGFAMGTCYFYLEFLLAWLQLLVEAGFENPAIFALDYTLVPDETYPKQLKQTLRGYRHTLELVGDSSKVCVAGDSAGGTLVLSLLLAIGAQSNGKQQAPAQATDKADLMNTAASASLPRPRMATLISPWVTLMSDLHYPSVDDFLNRRTLWQYAFEYAGESMVHRQPASPGSCIDEELWAAASPERGYFVLYGTEEVFASDIEVFIQKRIQGEVELQAHTFRGLIHAWPLVSLFLSGTNERRLEGLRAIVDDISERSVKTRVNGTIRTNNRSD